MVWSPPEGDQLRAAVAQFVGGALDGGDRLADVERVDRDVAGVGHLLHGERLDVQPRMVGPQQLGCGADVTGPEPRARPIGDAGVERDADDRDIGVVTSSVRGRRAKVAGPAYRGTRVASTGPIGFCAASCRQASRMPVHADIANL